MQQKKKSRLKKNNPKSLLKQPYVGYMISGYPGLLYLLL